MTREVYPQCLKGDYFWMIVGDFTALLQFILYILQCQYMMIIIIKIKNSWEKKHSYFRDNNTKQQHQQKLCEIPHREMELR